MSSLIPCVSGVVGLLLSGIVVAGSGNVAQEEHARSSRSEGESAGPGGLPMPGVSAQPRRA
jgi:hypothetical protein